MRFIIVKTATDDNIWRATCGEYNIDLFLPQPDLASTKRHLRQFYPDATFSDEPPPCKMGRTIQITQAPINNEPTPTRNADLCWRYVCLISEWTGRKMTPAAVLDHLLWGGTVFTDKHAYSIKGA